jgi:hypothetical protein
MEVASIAAWQLLQSGPVGDAGELQFRSFVRCVYRVIDSNAVLFDQEVGDVLGDRQPVVRPDGSGQRNFVFAPYAISVLAVLCCFRTVP